ncbi:transglutaminase family protein [Agromyces seonyuensis]|uniref:Transglutaminase family protein n=1 Tax=Agromyces seonyuensis TaxID=2662446 RepID=A0A6I4NUL3_9MICO|nr:transglutaminase family protein [Agromyces seonyuensis]MWB97980.1 transglutaminase family protein [Agromyces seonyuensis]
MSRLRIVHRTGFAYAAPATASYNEARMLPHSSAGQFVLQAGLDIRPAASQHTYLDYWGTRVSTFEVLTPHHELSVTATSVVEVRPAPEPTGGLSWDELAIARTATVGLVEQAGQTEATAPPKELRQLAASIVAEGDSVAASAFAIAEAVGAAIEYVPGSTGVSTTAKDAWKLRRGVCQDITHLTLGALRSVGIPARYVSGYLHPKPDAAIGEAVVGESHAWVEFYDGTWQGYDPTNRSPIGEMHVLVARGRDYTDVTPLRGVYAGTAASRLFVEVEITREA